MLWGNKADWAFKRIHAFLEPYKSRYFNLYKNLPSGKKFHAKPFRLIVKNLTNTSLNGFAVLFPFILYHWKAWRGQLQGLMIQSYKWVGLGWVGNLCVGVILWAPLCDDNIVRRNTLYSISTSIFNVKEHSFIFI